MPERSTFVLEGAEPVLQNGKLRVGEPENLNTTLMETGAIRFQAPLRYLEREKGSREIHPISLVELTVSIFRLARVVARDVDWILCDAAMFRIQGWVLRPGSPLHPYAKEHRFAGEPGFSGRFEDEDLLLSGCLHFSGDEIKGEPDRCARRLLERIYDRFGHDRAALEWAFDVRTGSFTPL